MAVNAEELFQGRASNSQLRWGKQSAAVTRDRQPANGEAEEALTVTSRVMLRGYGQVLAARGKSHSLNREILSFSVLLDATSTPALGKLQHNIVTRKHGDAARRKAACAGPPSAG